MRKLTMRAVPYQLPGYPDYLAALLHARGISDAQQAERFLNPSFDQLYDPFLMHDMHKACELIRIAAKENHVVAVYGDYDADGVCACAIILDALQQLGIHAFPYIPARLSEGYGLNSDAIQTLSGQAKLLISVDCGITAVEEIHLAKDLGMQVILTDHHTLPDILPKADAVVHPQLAGYPEPFLCGSGVAWKLACALLGIERAKNSLDLAALATVADLVPLQGENRVIVSLGLKAMEKTERPGLKALMKVSGIREGALIQSEHIAYQLAPRLNAGGRLATAQEALNLLLTTQRSEAENLAGQMDLLNRERRDIEQQVLREASSQLAGQDLSGKRSLVLFCENWNPGVVGLTAGKLAERWNYPAIVLTKNGEDLSGSGRSAGGVDLHAAIKECEGLLNRFGGHRMAAGLALPPENLHAFTQKFDEAVRRQLGETDLVPETVYDTVLSLSEVSLDTVNMLDGLAPFGLGNPSPVFLMENLSLVSARAVGSDQSHLKLTVAQNGTVREGIAFGQGKMMDTLGKEISLVSSVDQNEFNGRISAQMKVKVLLPGKAAFMMDPLAQARALCVSLENAGQKAKCHPSVLEILELPELHGSRGTLLIAYTVQTANELHLKYAALQTFSVSAPDPRSFHAILYAPDWGAHFAKYDRLIFADGLPDFSAAELAIQATGAHTVQVLPKSELLQGMISRLKPELAELREIYQLLRRGQTAAFTNDPGKDLAALMIFRQLGLVELDDANNFRRLLPMQRIDPDQSPLYLALNR